jgi:hypothetical protein
VAFGLAVACGAACGGGSTGPSYMPVSVTTDATGSLLTLTMGDLAMVVDEATGGRITEFSLKGTNVLTGPDVDYENYGATFWPSPQSSWCQAGGGCWPPDAIIDSDPYVNSGAGTPADVIEMSSGSTTILGDAGSTVSVTKQFTPVPASGAVDVTYTLNNDASSVPITVAPWQVSRVKGTGGLTFFGSPDGSISYTAGTAASFSFTDAEGDLWYDYAPVTSSSKALADGSGWIAHVTAGGLFISQQFPDVPPGGAAPGEAEIEVYTGGADYLEMEAQGAYTAVPPGGSLVWTVRWKLRQVPSGTSVAVGSAALASFANTTLAE